MKLKDSEKALLLGLAGIAFAVIMIMYVAKPNYETTQSVNAECVQLQARLDELNQKQAKREQYIADTQKFNEQFDEMLSVFPPDLNQEITVMFLDGIKKNNDFSLESLQLGEEEQFYTLGNNNADAVLDAASSDQGTESTEAASTEGSTTESTDTTLAEGETPVDSNAYNCYRAVFPINYYGSYNSLKDVINYVGDYSDRMTINSMNIEYDSTNDVYSGSLELYAYSVESAERDKRKIELNDVEIGVDNIFDTGATGSSESESLNKYDEKDGAAIESNYDFYAMLNASTSDVSAKVVGQNGTGKDASVIKNADNTVSTLAYDFYEKDGKNYCKYTLDNSSSYEAEVTSAEDIKILMQSSARKNEEDKAGVRVTIRNTTKLPVYVKISADDSVSPRVDITSKSGLVKVYK